ERFFFTRVEVRDYCWQRRLLQCLRQMFRENLAIRLLFRCTIFDRHDLVAKALAVCDPLPHNVALIAGSQLENAEHVLLDLLTSRCSQRNQSQSWVSFG